jgi:hypothetical protein
MSLTDQDWHGAAWYLGVGVREMKAVAKVESGPWGAFLPTDAPAILFERHIFHRETGGRFDGVEPGLSNSRPGGYGKVSDQHHKLQRAAQLDREAALRSCSWGLFQIMGGNHQASGHAELQSFVNAMYRSESDHLRTFVAFVGYHEGMVAALQRHDWAAFAKMYNGPAYRRSKYDKRLAEAYERLT